MTNRFTRRDFLRLVSAGSLFAFGDWGGPMGASSTEITEQSLLEAIEASDVDRAVEICARMVRQGGDPWKIHLSLFPVVQRVQNLPFINPHLPKVYGIGRELVPYLSEGKIGAFLSLETREYARRPKMEEIPKVSRLPSAAGFKDIESAIRAKDPKQTAALMAAFLNQESGVEFARRLLLLGSGYLSSSLGHSVSCTAFILSEMLERTDVDPWPALSALAVYFCKGGFSTTPPLKKSNPVTKEEASNRHLFRATRGKGFVPLHHTITRYAIERSRRFLGREDYHHIVNAWIDFLGDTRGEKISLEAAASEPAKEYAQFYKIFSTLETKPVVASLNGMIGSQEGRQKIKRFLVQGVCDKYQGAYDPHYLTGLGSAFWVLDQYWQDPGLVTNALGQYVDFFFSGIRSGIRR
jgi:hypothetical protein